MNTPYRPSNAATVVASVSGGKDSTAMALHLRELGIPARLVFFDTGWESEVTYRHIEYLEGVLGPIERRTNVVQLSAEQTAAAERVEAVLGISPSAFVRVCMSKGIFPRRKVRFCTQFLKVFVAQQVIREMHASGVFPVNAVGIRAAESAARAKLPETEVSTTLDCLVWRPIIAWTEEQVLAIHREHNVKLNPLYLRGAERVGCYPCIFAGKGELRLVGRDAARVQAIRMLEHEVRSAYAARASGRDEEVLRPPTLFTAVRRDKNGDRPGVLIDEALAWARTARGAPIEQMTLLDDPDDPDAGCMRWGMCEHAP